MAISSSGSSSSLPELLLLSCSLLQQREFVQQMPAFTVTYAHAATARDETSQQQPHPHGELTCSSIQSAADFPASSLAATLLLHQANLTSFTLQPSSAGSSGPFWVQLNQQMHTSSSSSGSSQVRWHSPGPCTASCPDFVEMKGAAVLGRKWLPYLLQLPEIKRLTLPVLWPADQQEHAQQLAALRAELSAAAASAAAAAAGGGCHTAAGNTASSCSQPLQVLQLLLVPVGLQRLQGTAATASGEHHPAHALWSVAALQQLLQAVLLHLPHLQQLELSVLGGVRGPREGISQLAASLSEVDSRLHSFSFCELLLGEHQPAVGHSRRKCVWCFLSILSVFGIRHSTHHVWYLQLFALFGLLT